MSAKRRFYTHTKGQSLVLVALAAVVLIAFVGLAVDGGNAYAQHRIAQNASDGSAVRGALTTASSTWRTQTTTNKRKLMLERINQAAEAHGIPDTDGNPGNMVNENVTGYYTNEEGVVFSDCPITTCTTTSVLQNAWGVEVFTKMPVRTYFMGVLGWNTLDVGARALGIAHPAARAQDGRRWSLFASDEQGCSGDSGYEIDYIGTNTLAGNVHTNGSIRLDGGASYNTSTGQISYVDTCSNCAGGGSQIPALSIVYPSFDDYKSFAVEHTQSPYTGTRYDGDLEWSSGVLGSNAYPIGAPAPVTYINGNLTITSTNPAAISLAGLIMVNGNVVIDAPFVQSVSNTYNGNGGNSYGASIFATGRITVTQNTTLVMTSYVDRRAVPYSPLLATFVQVSALNSNYNATVVGDNACVADHAAVTILANNFAIQGAVLSRHGRINIWNNSTSGTRQISGTVIGDTVDVRGRNIGLSFRAEWFPPQPDQVELME